MISSTTPPTDRLAAVWFADIVGYSRLSAENQPRALGLVEMFQAICREEIQRHGGRLVKFIGDAALAEFGSAGAAARAAIALEREFAARSSGAGVGAQLRVGIHVGEVSVANDGDIYGDGVNTASRLQGEADPGQVLASDDVCRQLRRLPEFSIHCLGERALRGMPAPVTVYSIHLRGEGAGVPANSSNGRRTWRSAMPKGLRTASSLLMVLLLAAVAYAVFAPFGPGTGAAEQTRLVVLPFRNLGPPDDAYFADGVTEEISGRLASIASLGVIARTSAMQYMDSSKPVSEIGEELNVSYLVEGSVRWERAAEDRGHVRVSARLIRISDGTQVWGSNYEVALSSVFQVQSNIAEQVVAALDVVLLDTERRRLTSRPTDDLRAYDYYLQGNRLYTRSWARADIEAALEMYERAVAIDPEFALGYAKIARTQAWLHQLRYDATEARLRASRAAAERAIELDPDLPEAHVALGLYYYWGLDDYERAVDELLIARGLQPSNAEVFLQIGNVRRRQGLFDAAIASYRRASELDPQSRPVWFNLGETLLFMRRYPEAEIYLDRVITLAPDYLEGYIQKARLEISWRADVDAARQIMQTAEEQIPPTQWRPWVGFWTMGFSRVVYSDLDSIIGRMRPGAFGLDTTVYYVAKAEIYDRRGQPDRSRIYYDSARTALEPKRAAEPDAAWVHGVLAIAHAGLDRPGDAVRSAEKAVQLLPVSSDALDGPEWIINLARIQMAVGDHDAAIDQLKLALSIPSWIAPSWVRLDPVWEPLHDHPRFPQLLEGRTAGLSSASDDQIGSVP